MLTEHTLSHGEVSLHYARGPNSGPPLLLLHGVTRAWPDYLPLIPTLAWRWHVHAVDFRGHGKSARRPGNYRLVDYVEDALTFLRHGLDEPAVIYGHSLGAMVALAAAARFPERCRAIVLEDPPFSTVGPRFAETVFPSQFRGMHALAGSTANVAEVARAMADISLVYPASGRTVRLGDLRDAVALRFGARWLKDNDPEVLQVLLVGRWLDGYDLDALLPDVRCPVLLLQGDLKAGGMLADEDARKLVSGLADCTCLKLDSVGHLIHWTHTEVTLRHVTSFLETVRWDD